MNERESDPFEELTHLVRRMIWYSAIFGIVISILAITGFSVSTYALYVRVEDNKDSIERNQQTIVALCRELNERNLDLQAAALDLDIPYSRLTFLNPKPCNLKFLREKFGVTQ